jgi:hypothetical protein
MLRKQRKFKRSLTTATKPSSITWIATNTQTDMKVLMLNNTAQPQLFGCSAWRSN